MAESHSPYIQQTQDAEMLQGYVLSILFSWAILLSFSI